MAARTVQENSTRSNKISVCIVDDHTLFRQALLKLIKDFQRVEKVSEAQNGKDFVRLYKRKWPDIVLLELEMPMMNGVETAEYLLHSHAQLKIIILTWHDDETHMLHMLQMGVHSFLSKNVNPEELERAIYSVFDQGHYHNDRVAHVIRKSIQAAYKSERPRFDGVLSKRETEVLLLMCNGLTDKEIAKKLSLSDFTVRNHHRKSLTKLGLKRTVGLIRYAYQNGLIQ